MFCRLPLLRLGALAALLTLSAACDDGVETPLDEGPVPVLPDPARGMVAFANECASCHASGDGLDLAFFAFTDTTIIRRAVAHVDTPTARNIVAHVRTLAVRPVTRDARLFQPGGVVLSGDLAFATRLFGADHWPAELTTEQLKVIDPLQLPVAVALPLWSVEESNVDWMPEVPLPEGVLNDQGALVKGALAGYRAAPTTENLLRAVVALRFADRRMESPAASCLFETDRVDYAQCFELRRWTSSLIGQHMIRYGITGRLHPFLHDTWWDVGNAVRVAMVHGHVPFENGNQNWASWMWLGWMFEPSHFPSVYTGNGLMRVGLPRHATFMALRSAVARPARTGQPYFDVLNAAFFAPDHWLGSVIRFGYRHELERIAAGDVPARPEELTEARRAVESTYGVFLRRNRGQQNEELRQLMLQVVAALPQ